MQSFEQKKEQMMTHHLFQKDDEIYDQMQLSQYSFAESLHSSPLEIVENEQGARAYLPDIVEKKEEQIEIDPSVSLLALSSVANKAKENVDTQINYNTKAAFRQYNKQLVQSRSVMYHQNNLRMLAENVIKKPEEQRLFVIRKVARELWTNFCVRGQESPMLSYLHDKLREKYNEELQFTFKPGTTELIIMRLKDNQYTSLSHEEKVEVVNTAWKLSQEIVSKYTL